MSDTAIPKFTNNENIVNDAKGDIIAKVMIYGDDHLSSKNYGGHRDYPNETLHILKMLTDYAEDNGVTHIIGLGDFTYYRFHTLEYRKKVEEQLERQFRLTHGNRYQLKGNHDEASYGMTEYEYYIAKGLLKPAETINISNILNINMLNYGDMDMLLELDRSGNSLDERNDTIHLSQISQSPLESEKQSALADMQSRKTNRTLIANTSTALHNITCLHDFVMFSNNQLPNFGSGYVLDTVSSLYGQELIYAGHIHSKFVIDGIIYNESRNSYKSCIVQYPGCLARPNYGEDLDNIGHVGLVTVYSNGEVSYDVVQLDLQPLSEVFNFDKINKLKEQAIKREKSKQLSVNIKSIIDTLAAHDCTIGQPELIIESMTDVPKKYRDKALELLRSGTENGNP